jgi:hypothetical protein
MIEIRAGQLGKFEKALSKEIRAAQLRAMHAVGKAAVRMLAFASKNVKDFGTYQTGWRYSAAFTRLDIRNISPHAVFVERGRRPGATPPPIAPIRAWAVRHGMAPGAAYAIAKNIGRRGIPARPTLYRPDIQRTIQQTWKAAMRGVMADAAKKARR